MESRDADVVIVGAGLSGLSAAYHLLKTDRTLRVLILEAKDRIGGRTLTSQLQSADGNADFWDLGGEWVGRPQPHLQYLLNLFRLDTFNPAGPHGEALPYVPSMSFTARVDLFFFTKKLLRLKRRFHTCDIRASVEALQSDGITVEQYKDQHLWTTGAKEVVDAACRCIFGLASSEMTLLYFLMYINSAGGLDVFTKPAEYAGRESRVKGGLLQLSTHLVQMIGRKSILVKHPVTHIVQTGDYVTLVTSSRLQVRCQRTILAIPPHHAGAINYTPPLPSIKLNLLKSIPLAYIVKFIFTYEEAFWRGDTPHTDNSQYGFQTVLQDPEFGPAGIVYDATSARGNPALVGFLTASKAGPGEDYNDEDREEAILDMLEAVLGPGVRNYIDSALKDWKKEPYNGGCFLKSLIPGTTKYFSSGFRDPYQKVHFAGTESATVWCGFMNGAIQAGFRASTENSSRIRRGAALRWVK
ncbi:probable flavin-containing monoamine oxidase A isoform X2 [Liolophura sinensis]|uniref:probable flavin-containing monoamine oxidase A isoform X2 n=1 Tax=Liolophura sinensis TaxID=3198878 RepID=UPI00315872F7